MARRKTKRKTPKGRKVKKISRLRKPEDMPLEQWQVALRKQFAQKQNFRLKNIGDEPIFSEFIVTNPETGGEYRVAIRGQRIGDNYCSCPDFAVNTLGTCKHIEFTLAKLQRKRGGKKAFAEGFQPTYSEIYLRYGAKREVVFSPGTECPKSLLELASHYFDKYGILKSQGYSRFDTFMRKTGAFKHDLRCYDDTIEFIAQVRDRYHLKKRIEKAFPSSTNSAAFRKLLKVQLYPYQRKGALFAAKAGRSLIADDMGLGKTIQAIAAVEILAKTVGLERVLIISPTSLKHQWKQEIGKFSERSAQVIEGSLAKRDKLYNDESFYKIINYEVVHRDFDLIRNWAPEMIILDEAQRIKNWKTRRAQSVKKLD
ncbi:MAG: ATP-dependent helicase, partial [Planctomycetota bacterium]